MSRNRNFISLVEYNPELVLEWHPDKNDGITPEQVSYGSAIKVWWKCSEGHEWQATPNHRSRGQGCPICIQSQRTKNRIKSRIYNVGSLADNNSQLAGEWHCILNGNLTPSDVTDSSSKKVWWQCNKGHEWQAAINSRNSGVGCPVCSGHKIVVGINDLATLRPDLSAQWHYVKNGDLKPVDVTVHNGKTVWWKCEKGHEWKTRISNRGNGNNCPVCIGKKVLSGYNDLATSMPLVAKEWHPTKNGSLTPTDITAGSNKSVWWQCEKGHEWQASVTHRANGRRCPKCFGESKTSFPEQAIFFYLRKVTAAQNRYLIAPKTEIDIYLPEYKIGIEYDGAYFHNGEKANQREKRKQETLEALGITLIRVREIQGEPDRNIIYSKSGANDIELSNMVKQLFYQISLLTQRSFDLKIDISRDRNRIYEQYIQGEKDNSLFVMNPQLASEWHFNKNGSLRPEYVSVHSNKKVWWQCKHGHEWQAVINSRRNGVGCPFCSGKVPILGETDLATVNPLLASEWHPVKNGNLSPKDVTKGSNKKVWWQCEKGHEWQASVVHRSNGRKCPICCNKMILTGYNDLATINPTLAVEWHPTKNAGLLPTEVGVRSHKKVWWKCNKGHEWEAVIDSRSSGRGCSICSRIKRNDNLK